MRNQFTFACPVCGGPLSRNGGSFACPKGHSFDRAKSGYINLLLPGGKHAKLPGDNRMMVNARREFLEKGFYRPMADELAREVSAAFSGAEGEVRLLDAGCGEGYYTRILYDGLQAAGIGLSVLGVDISKFAAEKAARRFAEGEKALFAAASVFHLPLADESCDGMVTLFAPFCREEFWRVLKPGGWMWEVIPGARHLWQLKEAVYDRPYLNEVQDYPVEGFAFAGSTPVEGKIRLHGGEIESLFKMTPYYYKTSAEGQARAAALSELETEVSFEVLCYRKEG